ncbi:glycoside hydrolase 43 family protein [Marinoscillum sp. MHG1-6]|uniref:glycoside hydrolase family 43 protein n=1 Tax=Marinoscillum sp. MHG1-6 TaxID=2959627 RepID=UPI002157EE93|nr:glycoside hydrolase 43 family protein [Marinoscillum sp. MHG1-6]
MRVALIVLFISIQFGAFSQVKPSEFVSKAWSPDNGDGTYKNPIIHADYSDPDICRAGDDFYMTSSSFNSVPALPILHSRDLVNWEIINYAVPQFPDAYYDTPQHGNGVWAPCFRYHDGLFYIYWGDPDRGIYMVQTEDPAGEWSAPVLVKKAYGNIDPSPLWDDDGKVYMVHAFAHSRAGVKSLLQVVELSKDGSQIMDKGVIVFDGHKNHPTIEGPKFYKRNGYYYIFAPAGGVPTGWQLILRSKNIYGPYEEKIVLAQGDTPINGPHQGGMVELDNGESYFVHFQDRGPYGRIVHLQPVKWIDDWPIMGKDKDGDGTGEPYLVYKKPGLPVQKPHNPVDTDEFNSNTLGLQWQWNAAPQNGFYSLKSNPGQIKLNAQPYADGAVNLWMSPSLMLQKFPAPEFSNTVKVDVSNLKEGEESGLIVLGHDYASIAVKKTDDGYSVQQRVCVKASDNRPEETNAKVDIGKSEVWLRVEIDQDAKATFSYSKNGKKFEVLGDSFATREGHWVGAKTGIYTKRSKTTGLCGYALFDYFRVD